MPSICQIQLGRPDRLLSDARHLYLVMTAPISVELLLKFEIGQEVSGELLAFYEKECHTKFFKHPEADTVTILAGDGHEKVLTRCAPGARPTMKRAGRPRLGGSTNTRNFYNGWFLVTIPHDHGSIPQCQVPGGWIAACEMMHDPENHEVVYRALGNACGLYPNVDAFLYDRACKLKPNAHKHQENDPRLAPVVLWLVDKFHGAKHGPSDETSCACNPHNHQDLWDRLEGVNSSIREQVFSWFPN